MSKIRELSAAETGLAYTTMLELRPHLASRDAFVECVNRVQRPEGYRLLGSFEEGNDEPVALAGFRTVHHLSWGYTFYVDDLVTRATHRSSGHGARLMQWLDEEARRLGCEQFHLDSGVQRFAAHRFYFNQRMHISSHHFARELDR